MQHEALDMFIRLKILFITVLIQVITGFSLHLFAQASRNAPDISVSYVNEKGDFFINQKLAYSFMLIPENSSVSTGFFVPENSGKKASVLPEGKHQFGFKLSNGEFVGRTIYVDGSAPESKVTFSRAKRFSNQQVVFYGKGLIVEFSATDELSGIAQTFYSINSGANFLWDKPVSGFKNDEVVELNFYSIDNVGNIETPKSRKFTVDVSAPDLKLSINGQNKSNVLNTASEIVLSASDNLSGVESIHYAYNSKQFSTYLNALALGQLKDGKHTLLYYATDKVGNVSDTLRYEFQLDSTSPQLTFSVGKPQYLKDNLYYITSSTPIQLKAEDAVSGVNQIRYSINNENETTYTQPVKITGESTSYLLSYFSTDNLGNVSNPELVKLFLDMNPPTTTFSFSTSYFKDQSLFVLQKGSKLKLESTDLESGVQTIFFRKKGQDFKPYTQEIELSQIGLVSFDFYAVDQTGNTESVQTVDIKVKAGEDNSLASKALRKMSESEDLKVIPTRKPSENLIKAGKLPLYFWISDSPSDTAKKYLIASMDSSVNVMSREKKNRDNVVSIQSKSYSGVYRYLTDTDAPKTTLSKNGAVETKQNGVTIFSGGLELSFKAEDGLSGVDKLMVSVDNAPLQEYKTPLKLFINEKPYTVSYFALDKTGNVEKVNTIEFQVDLTAPKTSAKILSNFSGNTFSPQTQISIEASDNLSGVKATYFRINNQEFKPYSESFELSSYRSVLESANTLEFYSIDFTGNKESVKKQLFKYDSSKPDVEILFNGTTIKNGNQVLTAKGTTFYYKNNNQQKELRSVYYQLNNDTRKLYVELVKIEQTSNFTLQFFIEDILGNSSSTERLQIIPDYNSPQTKLSFSGIYFQQDGKTLIGPQTKISLAATDAVSGVSASYIKVGNQSFSVYKTPEVVTQTGKIDLSWYSVDKLNNKETVQSISVDADNQKPIITVLVDGKEVDENANEIKLNKQSIIVISAKDLQTEIKAIEYKLNSNTFVPYLRALTGFEVGKVKRLQIRSTDILGNENLITFELTVSQ